MFLLFEKDLFLSFFCRVWWVEDNHSSAWSLHSTHVSMRAKCFVVLEFSRVEALVSAWRYSFHG